MCITSFIIKLRTKKEIKSILDDIEGVGPSRRKALMKAFKDIDGVRNASVEDLAKVDGITENVAKNIYEYFHK